MMVKKNKKKGAYKWSRVEEEWKLSGTFGPIY